MEVELLHGTVLNRHTGLRQPTGCKAAASPVGPLLVFLPSDQRSYLLQTTAFASCNEIVPVAVECSPDVSITSNVGQPQQQQDEQHEEKARQGEISRSGAMRAGCQPRAFFGPAGPPLAELPLRAGQNCSGIWAVVALQVMHHCCTAHAWAQEQVQSQYAIIVHNHAAVMQPCRMCYRQKLCSPSVSTELSAVQSSTFLLCVTCTCTHTQAYLLAGLQRAAGVEGAEVAP